MNEAETHAEHNDPALKDLSDLNEPTGETATLA